MSDTVDLSPAGLLPLPALYQALLAKATRHTTFYEGQTVVWHHWGPHRPGRLPLVMLHGGSGSWTHWIRNIDALLAQGFELWLPDLPGFGDSDPLPQARTPMPCWRLCVPAWRNWVCCPAS